MSIEVVSLELIQHIAEEYGYWAILSGVLMENTGLPIPGETIALVGGYLAGQGDLSYWGVLASTMAGAIAGDSFGYWIGKWGGWPLLRRVGHWFRIEEDQLTSAKERFSRNAAQAVFLGRFVTLLRIFAGPLAGISGMPYHKFLGFNAAGAALWASTIVTLAFFVGRIVPLERLLIWVSKFGITALGLALLWLVYWMLEQRFKQSPTS